MTDSPFLPGTAIQFAWDSTSLGWLKECPRKYYYSMICGWRAKAESVNLKFGGLYHKALENFDKYIAEGDSHDTALDKVLDETMQATWEGDAPWTPDHQTKNRDTLIRSVIWYEDHFKEDPAKTVILANGKPAVELSFRMELDWGPQNAPAKPWPYILCGHLDRLVDFAGGTYVMDRKTTANTISSYYFDQFVPDNQMSLYTMAAKVIYQTPVRGVIIDAVQTAVGFSRFSRGFTYRTDAQIEEWLSDLHYWFKLAEQYATAGYWPMNDKSCHNFGGCVFRKVCSKSPEARETFLASDFHKVPWNPLEVR